MSRHNERCRECKATIQRLLAAIFHDVKANHDLNMACRLDDYSGEKELYGDLSRIYLALADYRGHHCFVRARKLPRVDFFIPNENLIIEFDESQHFTRPREIALSLYPQMHRHGFSVDRWRRLCQEMNRRDNNPVYRDEQRAWYDTLRDFAPLLWQKGTTIHLFPHDLVWCSLDPEKASDLETFKGMIWNRAE